MEKKENIKKDIFVKLSSIKNLPVMPDLAIDLMGYTIDDDTSIKELSAIISRDPALAAQILKVANSSFYALKRQVGSLEKAIIILGLREIKNLIFTLSIIKLFPKETNFCFDKVDFLKHSLITARTSDILTKKLQLKFEVSPFLAGLLHDIGKIFLDQNFHHEYNAIIEEAKKYNKNIFEVESSELGTDHAYIGSHIANVWNFPQELIDAIKFHHCIDKSNDNILLICVISISNLLSNLRNNWLVFPKYEVDFFDLTEWKILERNKMIEDFDIEKIIFEIDDEFKKSEDIANLYKGNYL
ncbi:MAG: HDOD domain-containing protein [Actinomycetota bacterium]|nr:HDOD domain-containing protein [Actinomycetota bacterium]